MDMSIKDKVLELIELMDRNYSLLWLDNLDYTVECIVAENINPINEGKEEITSDNFDCDIDGHVHNPDKIPQGNHFDGDRIFTLVDELKDLLL
tara:strand:- start:756 stop:1034 length:279 start_codon:yes stop_codon:yes gene_type:complete